MPSENLNVWIFCNVIDNYGDIGVSWRLACGLSAELGCRVHLWTDDLPSLQKLRPEIEHLPCTCNGICLHFWTTDFAENADSIAPPDLVIETFACDLPENVLNIMNIFKPLWINWEYLSAEASNERLHLCPSLQANGLQKYFWFMGFSERSGGLLREKNYTEHLAANRPVFAFNLPENNGLRWLLFGYGSEVWCKWLQTWQAFGEPMTLLLAGHQIIESLQRGGLVPQTALLDDGDRFTLGCITLIKLPFVPQQHFDGLLHFSDGMIIRGEDSFARAQFSGKPFFWHIYPQDEQVHLEKLHAFWAKTAEFYPEEVFAAHQQLSDELNGAAYLSDEARLNAWRILAEYRAEWQQSTQNWRNFLFGQHSAFEKLAKFVSNTLK